MSQMQQQPRADDGYDGQRLEYGSQLALEADEDVDRGTQSGQAGRHGEEKAESLTAQRREGWLNTGGETLSIQGLRGKVVLLDFWSSTM